MQGIWWLISNKAEGKCNILVLIDPSAAFDTVDHHTPLCDLENSWYNWIRVILVQNLPHRQKFRSHSKWWRIWMRQHEVWSTTRYYCRSCIVHYFYANSAIYGELLQWIISFVCWWYRKAFQAWQKRLMCHKTQYCSQCCKNLDV